MLLDSKGEIEGTSDDVCITEDELSTDSELVSRDSDETTAVAETTPPEPLASRTVVGCGTKSEVVCETKSGVVCAEVCCAGKELESAVSTTVGDVLVGVGLSIWEAAIMVVSTVSELVMKGCATVDKAIKSVVDTTSVGNPEEVVSVNCVQSQVELVSVQYVVQTSNSRMAY